MAEQGSDEQTWFAVRCLFEWPGSSPSTTYEERVTLWRASSFEDALSQAEAEADDYASAADPPFRLLDFAQVYQLFERPDHGTEVFSLLRDSALPEEEYIDRHFETGTERQGTLDG